MQELNFATVVMGWASLLFGAPAAIGTIYYSARNVYRAIVQFESFRR